MLSEHNGLWSAEAELPPMLKLTLQHSKEGTRAASAYAEADASALQRGDSCSFRPTLKLTLQHSKEGTRATTAYAERTQRLMECGSGASAYAEADASALQRGDSCSFRPTLKLTLQHSKGVSARLSAPVRGQAAYGVRKRSFRPTLKLTLQHSKGVSARLSAPVRGQAAYGVRKRSFRPTLKLTLQHSKEGTRAASARR